MIELKRWAKKWGATLIKQTDLFGRYFKADNEFGIMIKWHYDDDTDKYYVKWQAWIGNNKERPKMIRRYPIPKRKDNIYLEAETERGNHHDFDRIVTYIKENNDKMIRELKDNINKRLNKLQS